MKIKCENRRTLIPQNHVWRYTLRLFNTFVIFKNHRKINAKRVPKSNVFCSQSGPWATKGRLILPFWSIFGNPKNRRFFDVALDRQKIVKNY